MGTRTRGTYLLLLLGQGLLLHLQLGRPRLLPLPRLILHHFLGGARRRRLPGRGLLLGCRRRRRRLALELRRAILLDIDDRLHED